MNSEGVLEFIKTEIKDEVDTSSFETESFNVEEYLKEEKYFDENEFAIPSSSRIHSRLGIFNDIEIHLSLDHRLDEVSAGELQKPVDKNRKNVIFFKSINFSSLSYDEKIEIKNNGRPTPPLNIKQIGKSRSKEYARKFNSATYDKHDWICGCEESNSLFCFPCILFGGDSEWAENGISDLRNLQPKIIKHQNSQRHLNNVLNLSFLGKVNILDQQSEGHRQLTDRHNESVKRNRAVLSKIIDCILFCGKFQLPLHDNDESSSSENPGVFRGLIDFLCKSNPSFESQFQTASDFKGVSKMIQNELLDSMLFVCQMNIKEEIKNADFLSVMCDETIDINNKSQMSIVFRYEMKGKLVERFWGFFNPPDLTGEALSEILLNELNGLLFNKEKLIAQTYDGAGALSAQQKSIQSRIKEVYKNAHYIHCYYHEVNLVIEKATSRITKARIFFNNLSGISAFFSNSQQRTIEFGNLCHRIPQPSSTKWNFKSRTVNAVYERREQLIECCSVLETSQSKATGLAASGITRMLKDLEFNFWLEFFSKVMPHVETLFADFQSRGIGAIAAKVYVNSFIVAIEHIKQQFKNTSEKETLTGVKKKRKFSSINEASAIDVCDIIIQECTKKFSFTGHFEASKLLLRNCFKFYFKHFPTKELNRAVEAYPMFDKLKLKTELSVLYSRDDIYSNDKLAHLLNVLLNNNLETAFSETVKLVKILLTTPMTSAETEKNVSTINRIKTFLQNSMLNEKHTASAMLSIEKEMINDINNFNEKVIDHFATTRTRKMDLFLNNMVMP